MQPKFTAAAGLFKLATFYIHFYVSTLLLFLLGIFSVHFFSIIFWGEFFENLFQLLVVILKFPMLWTIPLLSHLAS